MKLPLPETPKDAVKMAIDGFFKKKLLLEWKTFAPTFYHRNAWWVRCSAQVWNDVSVCFVDCGAVNEGVPRRATLNTWGKLISSFACKW